MEEKGKEGSYSFVTGRLGCGLPTRFVGWMRRRLFRRLTGWLARWNPTGLTRWTHDGLF